ncbi:MAG: hypothetical protein R3D57_16925 [Hyphomicrobiaceae bacterium]
MTTVTLPLPPAHLATAADPMAPARQALAVMAVLAVPTMLAAGLDDRLLNGVSVWSKPLKFQAALLLHFATLLWLAPLLAAERMSTRLFRISLSTAALMAILEIAYITLQAARGRTSHFNTDTPLEQALYSLMGVGATAIVAASFLFGWLIWRSPSPGDGRRANFKTAAALGLMAGSVLTLVIGGYLGSQASHWIGGDPTDATGLPITGWSTTGGDLRPAHFLATHMMQVVPVIALVLDRLRIPVAATWLAAATYLAITVAVALQAVMGSPLIAGG